MIEENNNTHTHPHDEIKSETPMDTQKKMSWLKNAKTPKIKLKSVLWVFLAILFVTAMYYYKGEFVPALVNGKPIPRAAVVSELQRQAGAKVLEGLINKELLEQEAKVKGITVTQQDIDGDISQIEGNLKAQGSSIDEELKGRNVTREGFEGMLRTNKILEKLIAGQVNVTDEEVTQYMEANKEMMPKDIPADTLKEEVKTYLQQQKVEAESQKVFTDLRARAKIQYWAQY